MKSIIDLVLINCSIDNDLTIDQPLVNRGIDAINEQIKTAQHELHTLHCIQVYFINLEKPSSDKLI